ncbi:MAG: DUF4386 domain-containing protein [Gammaproteobacteria bacterium]|nr:DUF4386 domain-containing protein [Gammaproteobacteria bacterium]
MENIDQTNLQTQARTAGLLYLAIICLGIWSEGFVRSAMIMTGEPAATVANIIQGETIFRMSVAADSLMAICDVALAILLYTLLKPVNATLSLMAAAFRLVQSAILGMNLLNQFFAVLILNAPQSNTGLDSGQANALAGLFLDAHSHGYDFGLLFFGINCLLVGYLIYRSGFLPRIFGPLLGLAGVVYLSGSYLRILAPVYAELFSPAYLVPLVAESLFCLWLLIKGVDVAKR